MSTAPRPGPPKRPAARLSALEYIFEFQDSAFREYMSAPRPGPGLLCHWGERMAESSHGLVLYAAGWAAAELTIHPGKTRHTLVEQRRELNKRRTSLNLAKERWLRAADLLPNLRRAQSTQGRAVQIQQIEVQLTHALAHTPNMEIIAAQMCNLSLDSEEREARLQKTRENSVAVAKFLLSSPPPPGEGRRGYLGLMSEACGLVGQADDNPRRYVFMPSSFRRAHHRFPEVRSSCLAMPLGQRYGDVGLQVLTAARGRGGPATNGQYLVIEAACDLVVPGTSVSQTLYNFVDMAEGRARPDVEPRFVAIGRILTMQIDEVAAIRRHAEEGRGLQDATGEN